MPQSFRAYTDAAKKFSPKKHREHVGDMPAIGKPCPLHDLERKRRCKQAENPADVCAKFQPNRSRAASGSAAKASGSAAAPSGGGDGKMTTEPLPNSPSKLPKDMQPGMVAFLGGQPQTQSSQSVTAAASAAAPPADTPPPPPAPTAEQRAASAAMTERLMSAQSRGKAKAPSAPSGLPLAPLPVEAAAAPPPPPRAAAPAAAEGGAAGGAASRLAVEKAPSEKDVGRKIAVWYWDGPEEDAYRQKVMYLGEVVDFGAPGAPEEGLLVRFDDMKEGDDGYECWIDIVGKDEWRWVELSELSAEGGAKPRLPLIPPGLRDMLLGGMHSHNKSGRLPAPLLGLMLDATLAEVESTAYLRLDGEWQASGRCPKVITGTPPLADVSANLLKLPSKEEYMFNLPGQECELLLFDPREAGCEACAFSCPECRRYACRVMVRNGRDVYSCMTGDSCSINKIVGDRRRYSVGLMIECLQCGKKFSTLNPDFLRSLPLEVSMTYPCDPDCCNGTTHFARSTMTVWDALGMYSDAGASTLLRGFDAAAGEAFELATLRLNVAIGKHWEALQLSTDADAIELREGLLSGMIEYEHVRETDIDAEYGKPTCSPSAFAAAYRRKVIAARDVNAHELQLATVTSHASGDHCVPIGRAFNLSGMPNRQGYVVTSTNRMEVRAAVIVPNKEFNTVEPLFEQLGADLKFKPLTFTVDDAHNNNDETKAALNKVKLEKLAELKAAAANPEAVLEASDRSDIVAQIVEVSCSLVQDVPNDLKHAIQRFINTLTCTEHNRAQFTEACREIRECFTYFDPRRDAEIKAALATPGAMPAGARVQIAKATKEAAADTKTWRGDNDCISSAQVEEMCDDGSFAIAFKSNRKKLRWPKGETDRLLKILLAKIEVADYGVVWTQEKPKGRPIYTYSKDSVIALRSIIAKLDYIVPSLVDQPRYRTLPEPDSRGLPVEVSLEGTNFTENANGACEKALSAPNGYDPAYADGLLMRKCASMNVAARIKHPDADGNCEPDLHHTNMQLVRANNAVCDRYGFDRQHPNHLDLPPRNLAEKQGLRFHEFVTARRSPLVMPPAPPILGPIRLLSAPPVLASSPVNGDSSMFEPSAAFLGEVLAVANGAAAADTPPPLNASGSTLSLAGAVAAVPPAASAALAAAANPLSAATPSWLALPPAPAAPLVAAAVPMLDSGGSAFDRPFHVDGPSTKGRGAKKAARLARAEGLTIETFNAQLGDGTLQLQPGEEWMLTASRAYLCKPGDACFERNGSTDPSGKKRGPPRKDMHDSDCPQRKALAVMDAVKRGIRVRRPAPTA